MPVQPLHQEGYLVNLKDLPSHKAPSSLPHDKHHVITSIWFFLLAPPRISWEGGEGSGGRFGGLWGSPHAITWCAFKERIRSYPMSSSRECGDHILGTKLATFEGLSVSIQLRDTFQRTSLASHLRRLFFLCLQRMAQHRKSRGLTRFTSSRHQILELSYLI